MRVKNVFWRLIFVGLVICGSTSSLGKLAAAEEANNGAQAVRAFVTNFGGDGISVLDPYSGQLVEYIRTGTKPHGVAISPDRTAVYVSNEGDGTLTTIDPWGRSISPSSCKSAK